MKLIPVILSLACLGVVSGLTASRFAHRCAAAKPASAARSVRSGVASLEMKRKGKMGPRMPGTGPSQAMLEQQRMYQQMMKEREDSGVPTFELFVRGPNSPSWYPAGALGGDENSKELVESWMGGMMSDMAKGAIDRGVAQSLFSDTKTLSAKIVEQYPQLKKSKNNLRYGYKIVYKGLLEKRPNAKDITELKEDMTEAPLDKVKSALGFGKK